MKNQTPIRPIVKDACVSESVVHRATPRNVNERCVWVVESWVIFIFFFSFFVFSKFSTMSQNKNKHVFKKKNKLRQCVIKSQALSVERREASRGERWGGKGLGGAQGTHCVLLPFPALQAPTLAVVQAPSSTILGASLLGQPGSLCSLGDTGLSA